MKYLGWLFAAAAIIGLILGIYWLFWQLWMYVLTQFGAPDKVANPSYWLFVCLCMLLSFVGGLFRGNKS
jgi:hypothetical protein